MLPQVLGNARPSFAGSGGCNRRCGGGSGGDFQEREICDVQCCGKGKRVKEMLEALSRVVRAGGRVEGWGIVVEWTRLSGLIWRLGGGQHLGCILQLGCVDSCSLQYGCHL